MTLPNHKFTFVRELPIEELRTATGRRRLYKEKGTACVTCGINCTRLILGKDYAGNEHIDLYDQDLTVMLTVGHIIPKSRGGSMELSNLRPLCNICNTKEGQGFDHICNDEELFSKHLKGHWVMRNSRKPFQNGQPIIQVEYKVQYSGVWYIGNSGFTYPVNKITVVRPILKAAPSVTYQAFVSNSGQILPYNPCTEKMWFNGAPWRLEKIYA